MIVKSEDDIKRLVESDEWMMDVLRAAEKLNLPDWWIGAGFLRNKVWNAIEGINAHSNTDVDLVYFNSDNVESEIDWSFDEKMKLDYPIADWEIRNQARMHYVNNTQPFKSTADAISHWSETATCVAVKMEKENLKFLFCYGINDLVSLIIRPIPEFRSGKLLDVFNYRVKEKAWQKKWPNLKIELS